MAASVSLINFIWEILVPWFPGAVGRSDGSAYTNRKKERRTAFEFSVNLTSVPSHLPISPSLPALLSLGRVAIQQSQGSLYQSGIKVLCAYLGSKNELLISRILSLHNPTTN